MIIIVYFIFILFRHIDTINYQFNQNSIRDYLRSQDIEDTEDRIKDRIHISDSDIYISAGYLYAKGEVPTKYNFQHAPLVKYFLGFSTIIFNNPFVIQIIFGGVLLVLTYLLGLKVFKSALIGILASGFLLFDPLFSDMISGGLLDLGQAVFSTSYVLGSLLAPDNFILNGISLGLVGASKSWTTSVFLLAALSFYKIVCKKEKIAFKKLLLTGVVAVMAFSLTYLKAFIEARGHFNIIYWQLRILKFLINHDSAAFLGGNVTLFLTGYFKEWWQQSEFVRSQIWNPLWPVALISAFFGLVKEKKDSLYYFLYLLPILYLLYISTGVPFSRYFILILPYLYLSLSKTLLDIASVLKKAKFSAR
ncbi:MAG: hypothetical protein P8Y06_01690 [Patescibacteria group bacterium]